METFGSKKGVTLLELSVVMFIMAIVSALIVGISLSMSNRVKNNNDKLALTNEITLTKNTLKSWVDEFSANSGVSFSLSNEKDKIIAKISENEYSISLINGVLTAEKEGDNVALNLDKIYNLSFDIETFNEDQLFFCTLSYKENEKATDGVFVFSYNPKVGDVVVVGGVA